MPSYNSLAGLVVIAQYRLPFLIYLIPSWM